MSELLRNLQLLTAVASIVLAAFIVMGDQKRYSQEALHSNAARAQVWALIALFFLILYIWGSK